MNKYIHNLRLLAQIFRNQYKKPADIARQQEKLLAETIKYAYKNVGYYRELFDRHSIKPEQITRLRDLPVIPITTKDDIRNNRDRILSEGCDKSDYNTTYTSGSSGLRLEVSVDKEVFAIYRLTQLRQYRALGYGPFDKMLYMRPSPPAGVFAFQKLGLFRRFYVSSLISPSDQLRAIKEIRPQVIFAYPSTLYMLSKEIQAQGGIGGLKIKFIIANSELLLPETREFIQEVFGCNVYDEYSCLEFLGIGYECPLQKMHVVSDNVIVEVVDEDGNILPENDQGRLIVTALNNRVMPYIRYEIGDIGSLSNEQCACGRRFPVFNELLGRSDDFIVRKDGSLVPPRTLCLAVRTIPGITEFQIVQFDIDSIVISLVISPGIDREMVREKALAAAAAIIGMKSGIRIEVVDSIQRGQTGKLRAVRSMINI